MSSQSIDLADTAVNKVNAIYSISAGIVAAGTDPGDAAQQKWTTWFFTYRMWHESAKLTTRRQAGSGPGRGLMQFEAISAWDTIKIYVVANTVRVARLADAAGVTAAVMKTALKAFADAGNPGNAWPASGEQSEVEKWLLESDTFGVTLMDLHLTRFNVAFPPFPPLTLANSPRQENALPQHAESWAEEWWKGPAAQRPTRITQFMTSARALNTTVPIS